MPDLIHAPWTDAQVDALNRWQEDDKAHPFTCTNRNDGEHRIGLNDDWGVLVATRAGWVCPDCDYRQDWAYEEMTRTGCSTCGSLTPGTHKWPPRQGCGNGSQRDAE